MDSLTALDHQLFFAVHKLQKLNLDLLLTWPTYLGSLKLVLPILFIFVLCQSRKEILSRSFFVAFPLLLSYAAVEFLKVVFKRPRPFTVFEGTPDAVRVFFDPPVTFSFPSGHASTAFATAILLSAYFGIPRLVAFGMAVLVGLTRIYLGVHFPSDVIAGAVCGGLITFIYVRLSQRRHTTFQ